MRNRLTKKLQDPSLKTIRLYDFRHFFATMLYLLENKRYLVGEREISHKRLETSLIYTQLIDLKTEEEFYTATAKTVKEEQLIANGWEYVTTFNDIILFRKRK